MPDYNEAEARVLRRLTLGEYRVGIDFNPGGHPMVVKLKRMTADLIDAIDAIVMTDPGGEVPRLKALAMTHAEDAAMWAVKAVTKQPR